MEDAITSESLPIPPHEEEQSEGSEPSAEAPSEESSAQEIPCELDVDDVNADRQIRVFQRWLQDQSVGRYLETESFSPVCGDREGFLVVEAWLRGPAGGMQSLSRALTNYYPGAAWTAINYERLAGEDIPLRLHVEIRVPTGANPRPRCMWDEDLDCPVPATLDFDDPSEN